MKSFIVFLLFSSIVISVHCNNNNNNFEPKISIPKSPNCNNKNNNNNNNNNSPQSLTTTYYYTHPTTSQWTQTTFNLPQNNDNACKPNLSTILSLCQSTYPTLSITNIVSINQPKQLLKRNAKKSSPPPNYISYRCLTSPFQSDALLVPSPCIFDHIHNSTTCLESSHWNRTAVDSCLKKDNMKIESYAVLLPCGVGKFSGVEFVCCPVKNNKMDNGNWDDENNKIEDEDEEDDDLDSEEEYEYDEDEDDDDDDLDSDEDKDSWPIKKKNKNNKKITTTTTTTTPPPTLDPYLSSPPLPSNEHNAYTKALTRLNNNLKNRLNSLLSTWSSLESRYQSLRTTDPLQAEDFKKSVTIKFQKTIKKMEDEGEAEKLQLRAVHEGRVLRHIDEMKKESMECVLGEVAKVGDKNSNSGKAPALLRPCYQKLFRSLHKDRHHTLAHFKHSMTNLRHFGSNYNEHLDELRELTLNRLVGISNTARESLNLMNGYPLLSQSLRPLIEDYVLSLQGRDDLPGDLLTATKESDEKLIKNIEDMLRGVSTSTTTTTTSTTTTSPTTTPEIIIDDGPVDKVDMDNENDLDEDDSTSDDGQEDKINHDTEYLPIPSHRKHESDAGNSVGMEEKTFTIHREVYTTHTPHPSSPLTLTLILALSALISSLAVGSGIILIKRRNRRNHRNSNNLYRNNCGMQYAGVDNGAENDNSDDKLPYKPTTMVPLIHSPEEKHVFNMQVRGYENPTYRFFEQGSK